MPENTFDIVSKIDLQEVSNAIQQSLKEVHTRFDLKDSKSNIELEKDAIVLHSADEYKLKAVNDILQQKLVKRGVSLKGLNYGAVEPAAGGTASVSDCTRGGRSGLSWICTCTTPRSPASHQRQWAGVSNSGRRPGSSRKSPMRSRIRAIRRCRSGNGASSATLGENSRCASASSHDLSS